MSEELALPGLIIPVLGLVVAAGDWLWPVSPAQENPFLHGTYALARFVN